MAEGALATPRRGQAALRALHEVAAAAGAGGMVGGQVLDLEAEEKKPTRTVVRRFIPQDRGDDSGCGPGRRAAGRSHSTPVRAPGPIWNGDRSGLSGDRRHSGYRGRHGKTGKREGRDAELNKATYPAAIGLDRSKHLARQLREDALSALQPFGPAPSRCVRSVT